MRVLLASPFFADHWDAGHYWLRALNRLGHSVLGWDYRLDYTPPPGEYDLALVIKGSRRVSELLHGPLVCYWPDQLGRGPAEEEDLSRYDRVYTMARPTPPGMIWLPGAWEPQVHGDRRNRKGAPVWDSIFIGTWTPYKEQMLRVIQPQHLFGNSWPFSMAPGMATYLHRFAQLLADSRVAVNVHRVPDAGLTRRFFEFIACTFTISDRAPGVAEVLGTQLADKVTFITPEHGRELLLKYLADPGERQRLWQAEQKAIANYTYEHLAGRIIEDMT